MSEAVVIRNARIITQRYFVGPYLFFSSLPAIGTTLDKDEWSVSVGGKAIDGYFETLEAAMRAALAFTATKSDAK
jgi:hypothetical protein